MVEELVEKILLSIPPEEPEILIRASLAYKPWCRLLSGNAFRSRYLALHGTAPRDEAVVWDPVSGRRTELRESDYFCAAAMLCSVDGCDHAACNSGPFSVACIEDEGCVDDDEHSLLRASVYSSYTQKWTSPACIHIGFVSDNCFMGRPSLLIGKQLYFLLDHVLGILRYDLSRHRLSVMICQKSWLSTTLSLFRGPAVGWESSTRTRTAYASCTQGGALMGTDVSIVVTDLGVFTFDRKSLKFKKLSSKKYIYGWDLAEHIFLYTSFNTIPALAGDVDDQRAGEGGGVYHAEV
ncbi:hypothetical protein VPH35_135679 [Triticum aestivum]